MEQVAGLYNQREVTIIEKCKTFLLKIKYGSHLSFKGGVRILGKLPAIKVPGSSRVIFGEKIVLNSDFNNSNTALSYKCTLVCGLNGIIEIGDNTMLNGVAVTAYESVRIGKN